MGKVRELFMCEECGCWTTQFIKPGDIVGDSQGEEWEAEYVLCLECAEECDIWLLERGEAYCDELGIW